MSQANDTTRWVEIAESLKPALKRTVRQATQVVDTVADKNGFQGWKIRPLGEARSIYDRPLKRGDSFILDFGQHLVGYLQFALNFVGEAMDAPVRLKFVFAEVPAELAEPFDPYPGQLSRAWLQDETLNLDVLPATVRLPRRYAFRYVKITVIDTSPVFQVRFSDIRCEAVTSADKSAVEPLNSAYPEDVKQLDAVSRRTLRDCMQTVFEDGPKRDRRLWLGDLRLQALTNYHTFKNYSLIKRCLYLFAGFPREDGLVAACLFEEPKPYRGHCSILDYSAFFAPTLLDYARASGDWQTARELWPVAKKQLDMLRYVNQDGLFIDPGNWWIFIDWQANLDKQASMHAVIAYCLRQTLELARSIHKQLEVDFIPPLIEKMTQAARRFLWDSNQGVFVSGKNRQVSWASQAWMILAGIMSTSEGAAAFRTLPNKPNAVKPAGPYLWHHVVDAMIICRMYPEAMALLRSYWGRMIRDGADTFWEVYDPENQTLSPYKSHLVNSYCHAWSCTPAYFIRKYGDLLLGSEHA
ncbi:MAG: sugar hydrolase [Bacillota bacterium]